MSWGVPSDKQRILLHCSTSYENCWVQSGGMRPCTLLHRCSRPTFIRIIRIGWYAEEDAFMKILSCHCVIQNYSGISAFVHRRKWVSNTWIIIATVSSTFFSWAFHHIDSISSSFTAWSSLVLQYVPSLQLQVQEQSPMIPGLSFSYYRPRDNESRFRREWI